MTTRAEMVEACRDGSAALHNYHHYSHIDKSWNDDMPAICAMLDEAGTQLTRDGELRERLDELISDLRTGSRYHHETADKLSALLKE